MGRAEAREGPARGEVQPVTDIFDDEFATEFVEPEPVAPETTEGLIQRARDHVGSARPLPLSSSVMVARDELLDLLDGALDRLPGELRDARWLLKERDEFLAARQSEADRILDDVRAQAERMVQRTEIVRQANHVAQRILEDAREEARRLRHEAEDYCDQKLAAFEIVLDRTIKTVRGGRAKLSVTPLLTGVVAGSEEGDLVAGSELLKPDTEERFFDQDIE
jgi:vacuolar-type H+-ATPase subunit H